MLARTLSYAPQRSNSWGHLTDILLPVLWLIILCLTTSFGLYVIQILAPTFVDFSNRTNTELCADLSLDSGSYLKSFYFVVTASTAVGYGDIVPCTLAGRIITLITVLIGVPLSLVCLSRLGVWTARKLDKAYYKITRNEEMEKEKMRKVRFAIAIALTLFWVFLSSLFFYFVIEQSHSNDSGDTVTYFEALYFTIVTLFTVGFGDYRPRHDPTFIVSFIIFLMIGLTLVSMCISIISQRLEDNFDRVVTMLEKMLIVQSRRNTIEEKQSWHEIQQALNMEKTGSMKKDMTLAKVVFELCKARAENDEKQTENTGSNGNFDSKASLATAAQLSKQWKRKALFHSVEVQTEELFEDRNDLATQHPFGIGTSSE